MARFEWTIRPGRAGKERGENAGNYRWGLLLIAALTLAQAAWLVYRLFWQPGWLAALPPLLQEGLHLAESGGAFTLALLWAALLWQQRRHSAGPAPTTLTLEGLYELTPRAFERYVAGLFRQKGYRVKVRGRSGDLGVDLEIVDGLGRRAIAQCKRYHNTVGAEIVRELYGTLVHERAARAFLVTTAEISPAARQWASGKPLTLIDGPTLVQIAGAIRGRLS